MDFKGKLDFEELPSVTGTDVLSKLADEWDALTEKTVPVSADLVLLEDSAAAGAKKKVEVGNLIPEQDAAVGVMRTSTPMALTGTATEVAFTTLEAETDPTVLDVDLGDNSITVLQAGYYILYFETTASSSTDEKSYTVRPLKNGSNDIWGGSPSYLSGVLEPAALYDTQQKVLIEYFAVNDVITLEAYGSTDVTLQLTSMAMQSLKGLRGATGIQGPSGADGDITWEGIWATSTGYTVNQAVENDGSSYVCILNHTSDAASEPGVGGSWTTYWDLMAQAGQSEERQLFFAYDAAGGTDIADSPSWTDLPYDTEVREDAAFTHAADSAEIEINTDGWYEVTYQASFDVTANDGASQTRLMLDTGTGYAEVSGTRALSGGKSDDGSGGGSVSVTCLCDLNDGDKLKVQATDIENKGFSTQANGTSFLIRDASTAGPPGPQGPAGSDGDVTWEGDWVTSTFYSTNEAVQHNGSSYVCIMNHTSGASSEPGIGASWETYWDLLASKGSMGDTQTVSGASEGVSTNAGATYAQKLRVPFTPDASGDFLVMWSAGVSGGQTERFMKYRVQQDDTTTLAERKIEIPKNLLVITEYVEISGFKVVTLVASTMYNFDLDFAENDNQPTDTAYIKETRMLIRRMSD